MKKITRINKILLTVFIILSLISIYDYTFFNNNIIEYKNEIKNMENIIDIYIHKNNNFEKKSIKLEISNIDEGDYINNIIKSTDFLDATYKFISAYNIDGNIILKFNDKFANLSKNDFDNFLLSINKTLKDNFKNINNIIIEIDKN